MTGFLLALLFMLLMSIAIVSTICLLFLLERVIYALRDGNLHGRLQARLQARQSARDLRRAKRLEPLPRERRRELELWNRGGR